MCVARVAPEDERYGSSMESNYDSYIDQVIFDLGIDKKHSEVKFSMCSASAGGRGSPIYTAL